MRPLARFATADFPLHPSGFKGLMLCPWRVALRYLEQPADDSGAAADTGSATHKAIAEWHRGSDPAASIAAMMGAVADYPQADLRDAAGLFLAYAADKRNQEAEVILVEASLSFEIAASPCDPTGEPIVVEATVDQVRREKGHKRPKVWDVKTSKKDAISQLWLATMQLAGYCVGAAKLLGEPVDPGGIIMPRKYKADGSGPAFWHATWEWEDLEQILMPIRLRVSEVRRGILYHNPTDECTWCHAKMPDLCLPKLRTARIALAQV